MEQRWRISRGADYSDDERVFHGATTAVMSESSLQVQKEADSQGVDVLVFVAVVDHHANSRNSAIQQLLPVAGRLSE
jgi:hypothetical protein